MEQKVLGRGYRIILFRRFLFYIENPVTITGLLRFLLFFHVSATFFIIISQIHKLGNRGQPDFLPLGYTEKAAWFPKPLFRLFILFQPCSYTSAAPRALQEARASSSGAALHITLSQASTAPAEVQVSSQLRIHSPSPQP